MQDRGVYTGETSKQLTTCGEEVHVRHGRGTYVYPGGCIAYSGDWYMGVKHGRGILSVGGGGGVGAHGHSVFEGDFIDGEMSGAGLKRWANGSTYSGQFLQGEPAGEGTWMGRGHKYEGTFKGGLRHGNGTFTANTGSTYIGAWANHRRHGRGRMSWVGEEKDESGGEVGIGIYDGEWVFDRPEGEGRYEWSNGSTYEGSFHNGMRHGMGVFTDGANGMTIRGAFEKDQPNIQPRMIKLRVARQPEPIQTQPDVLLSDRSGRSLSSRERRSSGQESPDSSRGAAAGNANASVSSGGGGVAPGSGGKLSKKKLDELRRAEAELAEYRAKLTFGEVTLEDGTLQPVIDEAMPQTIQPGHKLPKWFLCACAQGGDVAQSEHGRRIKITLRNISPPEPDSLPSGAGSARKAASAAAGPAVDDPADRPIFGFCTCAGARTMPWSPPAVSVSDSTADDASDSARSASGAKKKRTASTSSSSSAASTPSSVPVKGKRRSVDLDGPPPPFRCDGSCAHTPTAATPTAPTPTANSNSAASSSASPPSPDSPLSLVTSLTRTLAGGFTVFDDVWLSGACTPGLQLELVIEDETPNVMTADQLHHRPQPQPRTHQPPNATPIAESIPTPPTLLTFQRLQPCQLKLTVAGTLPKRTHKATNKKAATPTPSNKTP